MRSHLPSFVASLRSPRTKKTYGDIVTRFLDALDVDGHEPNLEAIEAFLRLPRKSVARAAPATAVSAQPTQKSIADAMLF